MDEAIKELADHYRLLNELWLNAKVTTMVYYSYGWTDHVPAVGDVTDIIEKYRAKGVIK